MPLSPTLLPKEKADFPASLLEDVAELNGLAPVEPRALDPASTLDFGAPNGVLIVSDGLATLKRDGVLDAFAPLLASLDFEPKGLLVSAFFSVATANGLVLLVLDLLSPKGGGFASLSFFVVDDVGPPNENAGFAPPSDVVEDEPGVGADGVGGVPSPVFVLVTDDDPKDIGVDVSLFFGNEKAEVLIGATDPSLLVSVVVDDLLKDPLFWTSSMGSSRARVRSESFSSSLSCSVSDLFGFVFLSRTNTEDTGSAGILRRSDAKGNFFIDVPSATGNIADDISSDSFAIFDTAATSASISVLNESSLLTESDNLMDFLASLSSAVSASALAFSA